MELSGKTHIAAVQAVTRAVRNAGCSYTAMAEAAVAAVAPFFASSHEQTLDARTEAEALADRAGIDIGDDYEMFIDDLAATLTRFAALSSQPVADHNADAGKLAEQKASTPELLTDIAKVYAWLREPDWNEKWDAVSWLNRRPIPNSFALAHEQWERNLLPSLPEA